MKRFRKKFEGISITEIDGPRRTKRGKSIVSSLRSQRFNKTLKILYPKRKSQRKVNRGFRNFHM